MNFRSFSHGRWFTIAFLLCILSAGGCASRGGALPATSAQHTQAMLVSATSPAKSSSTVDWATWGFDAARTGFNPKETQLSKTTVPSLKLKWSTKLGPIYAQPVLASNVPTSSGAASSSSDIVYAGDYNGRLSAVNAATGKLIWQKQLRISPPGVCDGPYGISSTPAVDRSGNRIYVVDGQGLLYAFDLGTGASASGWPSGGVSVLEDPTAQYVWSGLQFDPSSHRLYVGVSSYGDCKPWNGEVQLVDTLHAAIVGTWRSEQPPNDGAGVWGWGGVSLDPDSGNIFGATGNAEPDETAGVSDSVFSLTPSLTLLGFNEIVDPGFDSDFGSTPVLYDDGGSCLALENKNGVVYAYNRDNLSQGPTQTIAAAPGGDSSGDVESLAYAPATHMLYMGNSNRLGSYGRGLLAFQVQSGCKLHLAWHAPFNPAGTGGQDNPVADPTVANGVVYVGDGGSGVLFAYDANSGKPLWNSSGLTSGALYNSPAVANGRLYVGSAAGYLYSFGL